MNAIKLPVRAYQMRNSTLWNIRADDNERLAVELSEERAIEIANALNAFPILVQALRRGGDDVLVFIKAKSK